jgi:fatty-acyl-CoA synthase
MTLPPDRSLTIGLLRGVLTGRNGDAEVVTARADGSRARVTNVELVARATRLAEALHALGVRAGDRVGTLAWNVQEHLEAYWAVPGMGAVLHTLNPRLLPEQLARAVAQAEDRVLLVHAPLAGLAADLLAQTTCVEQVIVFGEDGDVASLPNAIDYEAALAAGSGAFAWPELDEHAPAGLCFTSGTAGEPKGVVYSHRTLVLHALTMTAFDPYALPARDRVLAVVPLCHAMGWNLPYVAALTGAALVLPDRDLRAARLATLIAGEEITFSAGVPTVWADLLAHLEETGIELPSLRVLACGGSRVPLRLMQGFDARGVAMLQGWGMTETGPGAARVHEEPGLDGAVHWEHRQSSGRLRPLYEARIRAEDGTLAPHDGTATGEIEIRGPMVLRGYLDPADDRDRFRDGWLRTGDIGSIDPRGWLALVDREKDLIKSGGEWISSLDLETALAEHPAVAQAAVIAEPDDRWMERPLACVVLDAPATAEQLRAFLVGRVAGWWIPEHFAPVDEIPRTSVGKVDKRTLRARREAGTLVLLD